MAAFVEIFIKTVQAAEAVPAGDPVLCSGKQARLFSSEL